VRRRFFVEKFEAGRAVIEGKTAHHLGRVLRAQAGQLYELSDGAQVWLGRIEKAGRDEIEFSLLEPIPSVIPLLETTVLLSIVKFDSFEWALEKATELGVTRIVPLAAARSEKALVAAAEKRAERWRKILLEASQQSRRVRLPQLFPLEQPEVAFPATNAELKVLLSEKPDADLLRGALSGKRARNVALGIGPEGGWTESEFGAAQKAGFLEASMGRLILRTETAVIAALAAVNYEYEGERRAKPGNLEN
jgi:16S rRNA (uracil1498-N3)-methyltransferase